MAANPLKFGLFFSGAAVTAAATGYVAGAFDPWLAPQQPAALISTQSSAPPKTPEKPVETAAVEQKPAAPAAAQAKQEAPKLALPTFDLLRVEPDGSVLIAGHAAANSYVEIVLGDKVIAKAKAGPEGDFAAVLDDPLKPGDYQLALRAVTPAGQTLASGQMAVVSIPERKDGQVLAMVEEAGAPSRILSKPAATAEPAPPPAQPVAAQEQPAQPVAPKQERPTQTLAKIVVEAVEIEGDKLFIAGAAPAGSTVRLYANDQFLGEARATQEGRFLLERDKSLEVGDYQIRADVVGKDGKDVVARAEVAFTREPGESVAAVSPEAPATLKQTQPEQNAAGSSQPTGIVASADAPGQTVASADEPKLKAVQGGVIIRRGDSLWRISRRVYGQGVRFSTIYLANNQQIRNPNRIYPGQIFRVPDKTEQGEAADMKTIGEQATTVE